MEPVREYITVEPRFNEVAGDRPNLFVKLKSRVRYFENLDITNLRGNDQNVRYIEVIVNDCFSTQVTSVTQINAIFVTQKCRVLKCDLFFLYNYLSVIFTFEQTRSFCLQKNDTFRVLICSAFIFCRVLRGRFYGWASGLSSLYRASIPYI